MSNKDLLTDAELESYRPDPIMLEHIERCRAGFGVAKEDFRIVDWGCGRGRLVLWLCEQGYDAVGVDLDSAPFANGADLIRSKGYEVEKLLYRLGPQSTLSLPDSSFHFVTSEQTLEHVRDLEGLVAEWSRLTMEGGGGFHTYPPHRRIVEPHLFMPLVHWLPKGAVRKWLIGFFVLLRIDPDWWPNLRVPWGEKVRAYYAYSTQETFYRSTEVVRGHLAAQGFVTEFVDLDAARPGRKAVRKWLPSGPSTKLVQIWYMNCGAILGLATYRRSSTLKPFGRAKRHM